MEKRSVCPPFSSPSAGKWARERRQPYEIFLVWPRIQSRHVFSISGTRIRVSRAGRRGHSVSSGLSPVHVARLGRLRRRRARRHGRASHRSGVLGARSHAADEHRSDVVAVGHEDSGAGGFAGGNARDDAERLVSDGDDRSLSVSRPSAPAGGEGELVRRRSLSAASRMVCPTT